MRVQGGQMARATSSPSGLGPSRTVYVACTGHQFGAKWLWLLAFAACLGASAIDGFAFDDPAEQARYQRLLVEFRCPKCLNESLASSGAPIAVDLRRTIRRLMDEGRSDQTIRDHLQARYGDFVLYDPPFKPSTWMLWFAPPALLVAGLVILIRVGRGPARAAASGAGEADRARARALLQGARDDGADRGDGA